MEPSTERPWRAVLRVGAQIRRATYFLMIKHINLDRTILIAFTQEFLIRYVHRLRIPVELQLEARRQTESRVYLESNM